MKGPSSKYVVFASIFCAVSIFIWSQVNISRAQRKEEILNVGLYADLTSLDPHATSISTMTNLMDNLYEPLVDMADDMKGLKPVLATSWSSSGDGLKHTLSLRKGVKFSDGTPFNAVAVKLSIERIKAIKKTPYQFVKYVKTVETPDDHTVIFVLERPYSPFLAGMRFIFPVSPTAVKRHEVGGDLAQKWLDEHSAGTGPYVAQKWERGIYLVWAKNNLYWRGWEGKHFSTVNLRIIYESDTQRLMVEKGDLDIALIISADAIPDLKKNPNLMVYEESHATPTMYIFMNAAAGPTKDVRVRKAIANSWNHEAYTSLRRGIAPRADGPAPSILLGPGYSIKNLYDYNIEKAKKLLSEAGYPKDGLTLKMLIEKGDEQKRIIYEVLRDGLSKLGIKLEPVIATWPAMMKRLSTWAVDKNPDTVDNLSVFFRPIAIFHPAYFLYGLYHSSAHVDKGGANYGFYSNPALDQLLDQAIATVDDEKAMELWRKANQMVMDDIPALFVDKIVEQIVVRREIKGYFFKGTKIYANYYQMYRE